MESFTVIKPKAINSSLESSTTPKTETYAPKSPIFLSLKEIIARASSPRPTSPLKNEISFAPAVCDISDIEVVIPVAKSAFKVITKK